MSRHAPQGRPMMFFTCDECGHVRRARHPKPCERCGCHTSKCLSVAEMNRVVRRLGPEWIAKRIERTFGRSLTTQEVRIVRETMKPEDVIIETWWEDGEDRPDLGARVTSRLAQRRGEQVPFLNADGEEAA